MRRLGDAIGQDFAHGADGLRALLEIFNNSLDWIHGNIIKTMSVRRLRFAQVWRSIYSLKSILGPIDLRLLVDIQGHRYYIKSARMMNISRVLR